MDIEKFAIRAALGNNGGTWAEHYTEAQREHWRRFVPDMVRDLHLASDEKAQHMHRMMWMAAKSAGGELRIRTHAIADADSDCCLLSFTELNGDHVIKVAD